jgi:hypothetical protein
MNSALHLVLLTLPFNGGESNATPEFTTPTTGPSLHWSDYDADGVLDVFVATPHAGDRLYRGDGLGLVDVTTQAGLDSSRKSRSGTWFDVDLDGDLDLLTASDLGPSRLWENDGVGGFTDVTKSAGLESAEPDLAVSTLDFNGDGLLDVQRRTETGDRLFRNEGQGRFVELDLAERLAAPIAGQAAAANVRELEDEGQGSNQAVAGPGTVTVASPGPQVAASGSALVCAGGVDDMANPGTCIPASTVPMIGTLYPQSLELNVQGNRVGIGTVTPVAKLDVTGNARITGQLAVQHPTGPPLEVVSSDRVDNLNVDQLDGLSSEDFIQPSIALNILGGRVGIGTLTPDSKLDVTGNIRLTGQLAAQIPTGPPLEVVSSDRVDNLNVDLLDGFSSEDFSQLGDEITSDEIANGAIQGFNLDIISVRSTLLNDEFSRLGDEITSDEIANGAVQSLDLDMFDVEQTLENNGFSRLGDEITSDELDYGNLYNQIENDLLSSGISVLGDEITSDEIANGAVQSFDLNESEVLDWIGLEDHFRQRAVNGSAMLATNNGSTDAFLSVAGQDIYWPQVGATGEEYGVVGVSLDPATTNFGVLGHSDNVGIRGEGVSQGVVGEVVSGTSGVGVLGRAPLYGVQGETTLGGFGVIGFGNSGGSGVLGSGTGPSSDGVWGLSGGASGSGVSGYATNFTGVNTGVEGRTDSATGWGVLSLGSSGATGQKNFIQPHPTDPSKEIHFFSLEGNESGTYFRGSGVIAEGLLVIEVPEEFRWVSSEDDLTVHLTAVGAPALLWVESKSLDTIVVRSNADVQVDYQVHGVRRGFEQVDLVVGNTSFVPEVADVPFGTQYPESYRRILVENGLLNSDYTPNRATAEMLGRELAAADGSGLQVATPAPVPGLETYTTKD